MGKPYTHLGERGHGQQRVVRDGVLFEVWGCVQGLDAAHLALGPTEQAARVTGAHPHHPPGHTEEGEEKENA